MPAQQPMEVTVGMGKGFASRPGGPAVLRHLAAAGATSIETYVCWNDFEPAAGRFDWSLFDADLEALRAAGLRWVPFFIAGPWYATPEWFRQSDASLPARCLEHGRPTGTESIWNPRLFPEVQRIMAAFADRYRDSGAIESLLLGVTGDYGEAIYTVTGNWPGDYHGHGGYWCGDPHALADFRSWLARRYGDWSALRGPWRAGPTPAWEDLAPPTAPARAPSSQAWLDFVTWYREAMTAWSGRWLREARRLLPEVELYLCTGGNMAPAHGSDFSEQCRVAAETGAGVRITNEGSDPVANLMLTRLVASACHQHGTFCGFEPASAVDARGVSARQFNATGAGARQLHEYQNNLVHERDEGPAPVPGSDAAWRRGRAFLVRRHPRYEVALLHSLPDLALGERGIAGGDLALARVLRPLCDFAVLDDHLVAGGALDGLRAVFLAPCRLWSAETAASLRAFVQAGGICVAASARPETLAAPDALGPLFGFGPATDELTGISALRVVDGAPLPACARLPAQHQARAYHGIDERAVPLLRLAHTPQSGGPPLVAWHLPLGRGTAVFYASGLAPAADDWMAVRGTAEALVHDLLRALPATLGLDPVEVAPQPGVHETRVADGVLGWNATDAPLPWRGADLAPGAIAHRAG